MSRIGSMLKPLTDSVLMFTTNGVDRKSIQLFNWSIAAILDTISTRFSTSADELRKTDLDNLKESISMVHNLNKAVSIPNFGVGVKSFNFYAKDLAQVKSVINDINIQKLNGLTMMLGHLAELNRTQGLKALIDSFKQFIEVFMEYTSERKKEIAIQEQRQQEIEDFRNVQTNQNVQTNPFVQNQAITNSLNNIQNQVQKANASGASNDPAVLNELNKIYRKLEALYSDMFVFNKTVSVFVESKQK
jgi:mevalonate kinase